MRAYACLTAWNHEFPHTDMTVYGSIRQVTDCHDCHDGIVQLDIEELQVVVEPVPLLQQRHETAVEWTERTIAGVSREIQQKSEYLARLERSLVILKKED